MTESKPSSTPNPEKSLQATLPLGAERLPANSVYSISSIFSAPSVYWQQLCQFIHQTAHTRGVHLSHCVVLLPFTPLLPLARQFWARAYPTGFVPQFQTSQTWSSQLRGFTLDANDISFDAARDALTATRLVEQAGLVGADAEAMQRGLPALLAQNLVEAAHQLATVAAAIVPTQRLAWAAQMRQSVFSGGTGSTASFTATFQWLHWESAVAQLALAWASTSAYASDVLFDDRLAKSQTGCLMVMEGIQRDPLAQALLQHWGERAVLLPSFLPSFSTPLDAVAVTKTALVQPSPVQPRHMQLHPCLDAQDEAQRAAACVLRHIEAGRVPVALVATDRALTRRIHAMLSTQGVALKDENGWKLSTTRAASQLMASLSACAWDASSDSVLDWLKNSHFSDDGQIQTLEKELRRAGVTRWQAWVDVVQGLDTAQADGLTSSLVSVIESIRAPLQRPRKLADWLVALRELLQASSLWTSLQGDVAGEKVLKVLHLNADEEQVFATLPQAQRRLSLADFKAWVDVALEANRFVPPYPAEQPNAQNTVQDIVQVVIVAMSQLLARPFAAVVVPGCDETRLNPSPELPGLWSAAQRQGLGLPTRATQEAAIRATWQCALQIPACDLLWRQSESSGEPVLPSVLVQELTLNLASAPVPVSPPNAAPEPRVVRQLSAVPTPQPQPRGDKLPVKHLSSSGYDKLRTCPYQFFALQQLGLQENDELEDELGKRDFGLWLHEVLAHFHEALDKTQNLASNQATSHNIQALSAMLNRASEVVTQRRNLPEDAFFPWAATWPKVRDGYVNWLMGHAAQGWRFAQSEVSKTMHLGSGKDAVKLVGRIDRIDRIDNRIDHIDRTEKNGVEGRLMVLDYKTESIDTTAKRLKNPLEDTQLAFYGALLDADTLQAAYINIGENGSETFEQKDIVASRDALIAGILHDLHQIGAGAVLPALGEGAACDYCAVRGLCRKDFWTV